MAVRQTTRRRLKLVCAGVVVCIALAAVAYFVRGRQLDRQIVASRAEGMTLLKAGDHFNALHKLGRYLQKYPDDVEALFAYSQARLQVKEPDGRHVRDAQSLLRRVLDLQPNHHDASEALLDLYVSAGLDTEAITAADKLLALDAKDIPALRAKAIVLGRRREFEKSLAVSLKLNEAAPLDLEGQLLTLGAMQKTGKTPEQILQHVQGLHQAHPGDPRFDILESVVRPSDPTEAKKWAQKAADASMDDPAAVAILINQMNALGMYPQSQALLDRAAAQLRDEKLQRAAAMRMLQAERFSDIAAAAGIPTTAPANTQQNAELLAIRAVALLRLDRRPEAQRIVDTLAAQRDDTLATTWADVIRVAFPAGEADDARVIAACRDALNRYPQNAYFRFLLGEALSRVGDDHEAIQQWQRAFAAAPTWATPLIRLANQLAVAGRLQEAADAADQARLRSPSDPAALVSLALAKSLMVEAGKPADADAVLKLIDQIQQLDPAEERSLVIKVRLLAHLKRSDEAKAVIAAAMTRTPPVSTNGLLSLAAVSDAFALGQSAALFDRCQQAHGMSAELAFALATAKFKDGHPQDGRTFLDSARQQSKSPEDVLWLTAWARYLDMIDDPQAAPAWVALADKHPTNAKVQWLCVGARSAQADRPFVGRVLERCRQLSGEQGLTWRIVRAKYLLEGKPNDRELVEASLLLNEVCRSAPDLLAPRLLLADCLGRLGNTAGAIEQLTIAANMQPDAVQLALSLAGMLQVRGDIEQARVHLDRVLNNAAATAAQRTAAAVLLAQQGDDDRALSVLKANPAAGDADTSDLTLATIYRRRGQVDQVEALLPKLLKQQNVASIRFVAEFYASSGRREQAESALAQLEQVKCDPGIRELASAGFFAIFGPAERAQQAFEAATRAAPRERRAWSDRIVYYLDNAKISEALNVNAQARAAIPGDPAFEALARQGDHLTAAGDGERALSIWLVRNPADEAAVTDTLRILSAAKAENNRPAALASKLRPLADKHTRVLPLQLICAQMYLLDQRADEAATLANRATSAFPGNFEPARLLTAALLTAGRYNDIPDAVRQWKSRTRGNVQEADEALATAYLKLGNFAAALSTMEPYRAAAVAHPDQSMSILIRYCGAQVLLRQYADAEKILTPLTETSPVARQVWQQLAARVIPDPEKSQNWLEVIKNRVSYSAEESVGLGLAWVQLSERSGSKQHFEAAQAIAAETWTRFGNDPKVSGNALMILGSLEEQLKNPEAAERSYRRALQLDPNMVLAQNNLAMLLMRKNRLAEAEQFASAAAKSNDPNRGNFYDTLGTIQAAKKEYDSAIASLQAALKLDPENLEWGVNLTRIYAESGRTAQGAQASLAQIEQRQPVDSQMNKETSQRLEALRRQLSRNSS